MSASGVFSVCVGFMPIRPLGSPELIGPAAPYACRRNAVPSSDPGRSMAPPPANPFRFGALARDDAFTDRAAEIAEILADPRNGQAVLISPPRRCGKTSLVDRVQQRLVREKVLVAQVN